MQQATATGHWKRALEKMPTDQLFRLEEQVADLIKSPAWESVVELLTAGYKDVLTSLTTGPTREHADQSRALGYLAGLEEAPNVIQVILSVAEKQRTKLEASAVADQRRREATPQ